MCVRRSGVHGMEMKTLSVNWLLKYSVASGRLLGTMVGARRIRCYTSVNWLLILGQLGLQCTQGVLSEGRGPPRCRNKLPV